MGGTVRLHTSVDIGDLSRDLRSFGEDLDKPLRDALHYGARMVAQGAKRFMRYRPEGAWASSSGARYGHIRDYYEARVATMSAAVISRHPASAVWEWGGTIHPLLGTGMHRLIQRHPQQRLALAARNMDRPPYTFHIPKLRPVGNAADVAYRDITQHLENAVRQLIEEHHLNG